MRVINDPFLDPALLIRDVLMIPAVSGAEARMYSFLLTYWRTIFGRMQSRSAKLSVTFVAGSQMLVKWLGADSDESLILLVAHVDREGFMVEAGAEAGSSFPLVTRAKVDSNYEGARAEVVGGRHKGEVLGHATVCIRQIEDRTLACLQFPDCRSQLAVGARIALGDVVTAHLVPDQLVDRPPEATLVSGAAVDNAAGVAVCSAAVAAAALADDRVNLAVLYTVGEEAGFLGALGAVMSWDELVGPATDVTTVVVDASSQLASFRISFDEWLQREKDIELGRHESSLRFYKEDAMRQHWKKSRCTLGVPVVRLEDRITIYPTDGAQLLYQASLATRNAVARPGHQPVFMDSGAVEVMRGLGECGAFVGGFCEGTVLGCWKVIRAALGLPLSNEPRLAVLAIPVLNYRLLSGRTLRPELCTKSALRISAEVLGTLAQSYDDFWASRRKVARWRHPAEFAMLNDAKSPVLTEVLDEWLRRLREDWPVMVERLEEWRFEGDSTHSGLVV